jgi:predicted DNA-binding protein
MNKVQKLAHKVLQQQEESLRFSVTLAKTDHLRLEKLAEIMERSKSAFCSDLIVAALDDMEELFNTPDTSTDMKLPSPQEYAHAFNTIKDKLTEKNLAMLVAHYRESEHTTTTPKLARAAGYAHFGGVNLQYARIGKMLADSLDWPLPQRSDGAPFPTTFLVKWHLDGVWHCTLHPQVIEALKISHLVEA